MYFMVDPARVIGRFWTLYHSVYSNKNPATSIQHPAHHIQTAEFNHRIPCAQAESREPYTLHLMPYTLYLTPFLSIIQHPASGIRHPATGNW